MGLNDTAWEQLFARHDILNRTARYGAVPISAAQIKTLREPRLMTKFDHQVNLPQVFSENGLAILPVSRGGYMISSFEAYRAFDPLSGNTERVSMPAYVESLQPQFLVSESIALNCAYACGLLQDFLDDDLLVPTVSGRMGSGEFSFRIDTRAGTREVAVHNAQIEIDAAYEGIQYLTLFEAKHDLADDFLVRQLYYPFRTWSARVGKPVRSVFLVFSNGTFHLYMYSFDDPGLYNSLRLVKQKTYTIETSITRTDIENLLYSPILAEEPRIPFPQANSMARVINLTELLASGPMSRDEITSEYAFDARQTSYYTDAARYLGLVQKQHTEDGELIFRLSADGARLFSMSLRNRQLAIAARILEHRAFRETLRLRLMREAMPDTEEIVHIMEASRLYKVGAKSTYRRRSSTVSGWISWIISLIGSS